MSPTLTSTRVLAGITDCRRALGHGDAAHATMGSRRWAARILEALDRGPARLELGKLLTDPDARVRNLALGAIEEVDVRQADWFVDALLQCLDIGADPEPILLLFRLAKGLPTSTIDDLALLTQVFLDDHPGHLGARILLGWVIEEADDRRV